MSWFDKLFGPNETTSQSEQTAPPVDTNDVYKRPKGKFRFPLNVDNHVQRQQASQKEMTANAYQDEDALTRQGIKKPEYTHDTSGFAHDYVPRRKRRRENGKTFINERHSSENVAPSYTPKRKSTRYESVTTPKYQSYEPKREKPKYTSNDYQVHKPIFKASEVPSAIYGTKKPPENRQYHQPVKKLEGQKSIEKRPETPTYRKEDNTINIENIYASQIVAEIRREREKKLKRQKAFQEKRAQLKLQESEIEAMMHLQDDVERIDIEQKPLIEHESNVSLQEPEKFVSEANASSYDAESSSVPIDEIENEMAMDTEESIITLTEADLVENTDVVEMDSMVEVQVQDEAQNDFIEENVSFEDVTIDETDDVEDTEAIVDLMNSDIKYELESDSEPFDDVSFEEFDVNEEVNDVVNNNEIVDVQVEDENETHPEDTKVKEAIPLNVVSTERAIEVENNEFRGNINDVKSLEPVLKPVMKEKVSPFNVVMTPSDKKKWMDFKRKEAVSQSMQKAQINKHPSQHHTVTTHEQNQGQPLKSNVTEEQKEKKRIGPKYLLPPVSLLQPEDKTTFDEASIEEQREQLNDAFYHFNVPATVENVVVGPSVTRFELSVEKGVKVSRITNLQDDIKMALAAKDIRIEAPIPGTSLVGVEVPNKTTRKVNLSEVQLSKKLKFADSHLSVALGVRINNEPMIMDLAKMPHGLIAGATGSGKSVAINSILVSLLYRNNPNELKLLLIDPKMVELAPYNDLPHLIAPVITDVKAATESLKWVVEEMERRYKVFADLHVRNITAFNQKASYQDRMPKIVVVIDELADLMMVAPQDVEHAIARIAQKARACGIHLILATQRPSVNVITGLIKANVPTRIAFMVSSSVDSRTILDIGGAEKLLGNGDMLYLGNGMNKPIRIQGCYVSDDEIDQVVQYVKSQGEPNYLFQQETLLKKVSEQPKDELFDEICDYMIDEGHISTSLIQRRFQIGYNRAARIVDQLETLGYISGQNGSKPRAVLITEKQSEY